MAEERGAHAHLRNDGFFCAPDGCQPPQAQLRGLLGHAVEVTVVGHRTALAVARAELAGRESASRRHQHVRESSSTSTPRSLKLVD